MREIKFRAWDIKNKLMRGVTYISNMGVGGYFITCENGLELDGLREGIPMQYTGLKDKNGKEIYEGDIILLKRYNLNNDAYFEDISTELKLEVVFQNGCFNGVYRDSGGSSSVFGILREGGYKIGNIYENPDLIYNNHN